MQYLNVDPFEKTKILHNEIVHGIDIRGDVEHSPGLVQKHLQQIDIHRETVFREIQIKQRFDQKLPSI